MTNSDEESFAFFDLDQDALDVEWVSQPRLFFRHAKRLADARRDHEAAKSDRDLVEAELYAEVRADPGSFGVQGDKPTETAVKQAIVVTKRFRKADAAVLEAKHAMDVIGAAVDALDHRKKALEGLVQLHGMSYFSSPRAKGAAAGVDVQRVEDAAIFGKGKKKRKE